MTSFQNANAIELARQLARTELGLASRMRHGVLLAAALAMTIVVLSLLLTEPALPARTRLAFIVMAAIGFAWSSYAGWVLTRRRPLFGRQRVVAGWLALAFASLFTAGSLWIGIARDVLAGLTAGGAGMAMVIAASVLLRQALQRRGDLERRLRQLDAERAGDPP